MFENYYNPANRVDYSDFTFSDFLVRYSNQKNELYKLQNGYGKEGIEIEASSYKKITPSKVIWGNVYYANQSHKGVQWNNTLDLDIIAPYVLADSTSNSFKYEAYEFSGGYAKQWNKFTLGLEAHYAAHMGYKKIDPRPKSITSNIDFTLGLGYQIYREWKVNAYGKFNKYTQNVSVSFANEAQKAALYQMTGLGTWNKFFSGKSSGAVYELYGTEVGGGLVNNYYKLSLGFAHANSLLKKDIQGIAVVNSTDFAEGNRLSKIIDTFYLIKYFTIDQDQLAFKYVWKNQQAKGTDIYYSDNGSGLVKLLEQSPYRLFDENHKVEVLYQKNTKNSQWTINPFFEYQDLQESLSDIESKQQFVNMYYGMNLQYNRQISKNQTLSISPSIRYKKNVEARNQLNVKNTKESIKNWMLNDFEYLSEDGFYFEGNVQYTFTTVKNVPTYVGLNYSQTKFKNNKKNNYLGITLGVMF